MPSLASVAKAVGVLLVLVNAKVLPLMFHLRFYAMAGWYLYLRRSQRAKSVFEPNNYHTYTPLMELDFNMHKSNSTYFSDMDMARAKLMLHVFKPFWLKFRDPDVRMHRHEFTYAPLGSVATVFRQEIPAYTSYTVRSRVLGWTSKWLFVLSVFERPGKVYAYGLSKYVFKQRRKTIPPVEAVRFCGLLTPEAEARNARVAPYLDMSLNLEKVGELFHLDDDELASATGFGDTLDVPAVTESSSALPNGTAKRAAARKAEQALAQ